MGAAQAKEEAEAKASEAEASKNEAEDAKRKRKPVLAMSEGSVSWGGRSRSGRRIGPNREPPDSHGHIRCPRQADRCGVNVRA